MKCVFRMKCFKTEEGFTIIELLVGINIAFILLTLIIAFYLIVLRFSFNTIKKMDEKTELTDCIFKIEEMFYKKGNFIIKKDGSSSLIIFEKLDSLSFSPYAIKLKKDEIAVGLGKNEITLNIKEGNEKVLFPSGALKDIYSASEIGMLTIKIVKNKHEYSFRYQVPEASEGSFKDIESVEK